MTQTGDASGTSLDEVTARYQAERAKRLRPDGLGQYEDIRVLDSELDRDPYVGTPLVRDVVHDEVDVVIVGAGLGGLQAAVRLAEQGVTNVRIIDKAGDFGGTWYWNRYPGAACDVESYIYMPLLEETGYVPSEKYAKAPEIFAHCQRIAEQFDLYPNALFQTNVTELRWLDEASRWQVSTDRGDRILAKFTVVAGGILHRAKLPRIPGVETFRGTAFHTSRWNYDYTGGSAWEPLDKLADKRVALIGTGATSVQVFPRLAQSAEHVYLCQRTPSAVGVRANQRTDPDWAAGLEPGWQRERIENFTRIVSGDKVDTDLVADGWTEIFGANPNAMGLTTLEEHQIDLEQTNAVRARIEAIVADASTAEALKPWYNMLCKRPCFHDEYLPAFNEPNVTLLDTDGQGVERITKHGVVVQGVEYPVDCIIFGSGFGAEPSHTSRLGFEIYGRWGLSLTEAWERGPATLHGLLSHGFPNLLQFSLLQSGIAINYAHLFGEHATHAGWLIGHCIKEGITEIEPTVEAENEWLAVLHANLGAQAMFLAQCTPGYFNAEGNLDMSADPEMRGIPFFGPTMDYLQILRDWRAAGDLHGLQTRTRTRQS